MVNPDWEIPGHELRGGMAAMSDSIGAAEETGGVIFSGSFLRWRDHRPSVSIMEVPPMSASPFAFDTVEKLLIARKDGILRN